MGVPYLTYILRVELHHVVGMLGFLHRRTKATHSFRSRGCGGSPSLLAHRDGRINVVDVWARLPLTVSGVLCGLDGKKIKAPSMPCTIPSVGFK
jgi:hypothetical protein